MAKKRARQRGDDSSSSDASSGDGMSTEETRSTRSSRKTRSKEAKGIKRMLKELKDELKWMLDELKDETIGMKKELKKLNENQIVLCGRLEQLNGSIGDVSPAPRSEPDQMELPKFRLRITSKVKDKVVKGESILTEHGDPINIVLCDGGGNVIADNHPLAFASVMMYVLNGEFNKGDTEYNWRKEDFEKSILKELFIFNLAGGRCSIRDVKILENSSNKKVRLGVMVASQTKERVLEGLSNRFLVRDPSKKSKEVMEQFLTPLPEPAPVDGSSTPGNSTHEANLQCPQQPSSYNGGGHFHATTDNMMNPFPCGPNGFGNFVAADSEHMSMLRPVQPLSDWPAGGLHSSPISDLMSRPLYSPTGFGNFVAADSEHMSMLRQVQPLSDWPAGGLHSSPISDLVSRPLYSPTGSGRLEYIVHLSPVQLLWDRPYVEPSKRWNLLDQLMPLYSRQPKIHSGDFPTMRLMPEHYDSLTTYLKMMNLQITTIPKEVMQTHRNRGVLIQPLEPDDSDDEPLLKRKLHNKYQLRFVNKVCEAYYTREQIKADDGNLLNVALYDENNSKITSGPLSSASVEVVVLHGDFNANGQDYWTSEEFSSCVVCPQSGKGQSALGGDHLLVLVDGEASVGYAFFQKTSSFARTGKFKMGVKMKITIEERIQEGISESFFVTSRQGKGLNSNSNPPLSESRIATRGLCIARLFAGHKKTLEEVRIARRKKRLEEVRIARRKKRLEEVRIARRTRLEEVRIARRKKALEEGRKKALEEGRKKAFTTLVRPDYMEHVCTAPDLEESKSTMDRVLKDHRRVLKNPPEVIPHLAHPVHELKLLTTGGAQFLCDGCQEPGYGPRYRCETCNFDLHTWCALAPDTLMHPLFEGCRFVYMPASPTPDGHRLCDACGDRVRGFLYHCRERDLDLHPCCVGLAMSIVLDGPAYELCKGVSPPCNMCIDRCPGTWFYRSHMDGEAVDIHVACVKRMARGSPEVGDLAHVAKMIKGQLLRSLPMKTLASGGFERFCNDVGTVASLIIAVIFGVPTSMVAALEWF